MIIAAFSLFDFAFANLLHPVCDSLNLKDNVQFILDI